jgi:cytochrome c oxidase subunit 4
MDHDHAEEMFTHIRIYLGVFAALAVLTVVTVGVSYMHVTEGAAVALALVIAITKASLVALYFMHLIDEKKGIYWLLGLTATMFVFVMYMPSAWKVDEVKQPPLWSVLPVEGNVSHGSHGGGHGEGHAQEGHAEEAGHAAQAGGH